MIRKATVEQEIEIMRSPAQIAFDRAIINLYQFEKDTLREK